MSDWQRGNQAGSSMALNKTIITCVVAVRQIKTADNFYVYSYPGSYADTTLPATSFYQSFSKQAHMNIFPTCKHTIKSQFSSAVSIIGIVFKQLHKDNLIHLPPTLAEIDIRTCKVKFKLYFYPVMDITAKSQYWHREGPT